jgi:hypothetical protein
MRNKKQFKTVEQLIAALDAKNWPHERVSKSIVRFSFDLDSNTGSLMYNAMGGSGMGRLYTMPRVTEFTTASPFEGIPWFDALLQFLYGGE